MIFDEGLILREKADTYDKEYIMNIVVMSSLLRIYNVAQII